MKDKKIEITELEYKMLRWVVGKLSRFLDEKDPSREEKEKSSNECADIIKVFEQINPAAKRMYSQKPQRDAANRLVKEYGKDRVVEAAELAVKAFGKEHAPLVISPYHLELKWANLKSYYINKGREKKGEDSIEIK